MKSSLSRTNFWSLRSNAGEKAPKNQINGIMNPKEGTKLKRISKKNKEKSLDSNNKEMFSKSVSRRSKTKSLRS